MVQSQRMVDPQLKNFFDSMPGAWGCKDEHSIYMYSNDAFCKLVGLPSHDDAIGRTDYEMPCDTSKCGDLFRAQDQKVMSEQKSLKVLDVHPFAGGIWRAYIFTKIPMYDDNRSLIGTIYHGEDITNSSTIELSTVLSKFAIDEQYAALGQNSYMLNLNYTDIKLTERQSEVLFYMLRGKSNKKISQILCISARTVEEYIEQMRHKFDALNKNELMDKAISHGFLKVIPHRLFRKQLSIELQED